MFASVLKSAQHEVSPLLLQALGVIQNDTKPATVVTALLGIVFLVLVSLPKGSKDLRLGFSYMRWTPR